MNEQLMAQAMGEFIKKLKSNDLKLGTKFADEGGKKKLVFAILTNPVDERVILRIGQWNGPYEDHILVLLTAENDAYTVDIPRPELLKQLAPTFLELSKDDQPDLMARMYRGMLGDKELLEFRPAITPESEAVDEFYEVAAQERWGALLGQVPGKLLFALVKDATGQPGVKITKQMWLGPYKPYRVMELTSTGHTLDDMKLVIHDRRNVERLLPAFMKLGDKAQLEMMGRICNHNLEVLEKGNGGVMVLPPESVEADEEVQVH